MEDINYIFNRVMYVHQVVCMGMTNTMQTCPWERSWFLTEPTREPLCKKCVGGAILPLPPPSTVLSKKHQQEEVNSL